MKKVCVFCGAANGKNPKYVEFGKLIGQFLAEKNYGLVYGGATVGLMGAVANVMVDLKKDVIGVIPKPLVSAEVAHYGITRLEIVETMHLRKERMYSLADAFLIIPGGLGTLDEMFEILTWAQLNFHQKPIYLLNFNQFFNHLLAHIQHAAGEGFIKTEHLNLIRVIDSIEELIL
jgi:uncharacterized protein (TIGR00730 family)